MNNQSGSSIGPQVRVDVNEVIAVLKNQRNAALDEVAIQVARVADLEKKVKELEESRPAAVEQPS